VPYATREVGETPEDAVSRTQGRLAVFSDIYPPGSPVTRRSMVVTFPSRESSVESAPGEPESGPPLTPVRTPNPPQAHRVSIKTRPLPPTGAATTAAEKFWLKLLELDQLGLTTDDIRLPSATVGGVKRHTVDFAHAVNDPDDPLYEQPSAINPNSTPLWRPPSPDDFPRYLLSGQLAEWMNVKAAELRVSATVAVRKSTVDALGHREQLLFFARNPRIGKVRGVPAYLVDAEANVTGTTAKTRVYPGSPSVGMPTTADPEEIEAANVAAANAEFENSVIPGLAQALYTARATAHYEGSMALVGEEAMGDDYLGSVVRLVHPDRADWGTMRGLVQQVTHDLRQGSTKLAFGPPAHLTPADHRSLAEGARVMARSAAVPPVPTPPSYAEEIGTPVPVANDGGVFPGTVSPVARSTASGNGDRRLWAINVLDPEAAEFTIANPGTIIRDLADPTVALTIDNEGDPLTAEVGKLLVLLVKGWEATGDPPEKMTVEYEVKLWGDWGSSAPWNLTTPEEEELTEYSEYRFPLWSFHNTGGPDRVEVGVGVYAQRMIEPSHLAVVLHPYQRPVGFPVLVPRLVPSHRAIPS
jgi:hypothetical protein